MPGFSRPNGFSLNKLLIYIILFLLAFLAIIPFLLMSSISLQENVIRGQFPIDLIPDPLVWENYSRILTYTEIIQWFYNSMIVAVLGSALAVFNASLAGYVFARMQFPGREVLFWSFVAMLMIPIQVTLIPLYFFLGKFSWLNSYQALLLPGVTSAFGTFLIRQYILTVPTEYDDAARIDGCSELGIYWRVIMPLIKPVIATLAALQFINYWNSFLYPLIVTTKKKMYTLPVGLAILQDTVKFTELMAATTIAFIPSFLVFLFFQRYFVSGLTMSGLKG